MNKTSAKHLVKRTLEYSFDKGRFAYLVKNILNHVDEDSFTYQGNLIFDDFDDSIAKVERTSKYTDPQDRLLDILVVHLKKETSLERARTMQRNFVAKYLNGSRGGVLKDAALVAFVAPNSDDWRFSFVKMEYRFDEKGKVKEEFTPARRYSFLVGKNEHSHTAQSNLLPLLQDDEAKPTLADIEQAFSVERVTKEFFEKYRELYLHLKEALDEIVEKDPKIEADFEGKSVDTVDFAKKLMGQIVFLYFLQKKGWFGVARGKEWGEGNKQFLRHLFSRAQEEDKNYFNRFLEPLFYEALRLERPKDYYDQFERRIPFLNGGLFDPINDYDWQDTDIEIPNDIFSNNELTKEGDTGSGILNVFDRYNFTVKEDEPLEKEVAVDPEMLGKVFENLLDIKDRKSKGTYYTPREIVHYMCQESLINALHANLDGIIAIDDLEVLIKHGDAFVEHEETRIEKIANRKAKNADYKGIYKRRLPASIEEYAELIDDELASMRVCDPAVGSGAFVVGMMNEIVRVRRTLASYTDRNKEDASYRFKRHTIQHCLYGVDIDPGAVEIAKLRLWLSLVVDEEDRGKIKPLPNLDYKIIQGNSLLSVEKDLFNQELFNRLEKLKPLYFNQTNPKKKQKYKNQIDELISQITKGHKEFDFEVYFSEVFHEKKGFDIVIGNPPYVESRNNLLSNEMKDAYGNQVIKDWGEPLPRGSDLLIYFYARSSKLLGDSNYGCFITQNAWLNTDYGKKFQDFALEKFSFQKIIDTSTKFFSDTKSQNINAIITIFTKRQLHNIQYAIANNNMEITSKRNIEAKQTMKWGTLFSMPSFIQKIFSNMSDKSNKENTITFGQGLNFPLSKLNEHGADIPVVVRDIRFIAVSADGMIREVSTSRKDRVPALIMPRGVGSRHYCTFNLCKAFSYSHVELYIPSNLWNSEIHYCLWAYLNSSLVWLFREITGRKNLGGGMLKAEATDMKTLPIGFNFGFVKDAKKAFNNIKDREPLPVWEEIWTEEHLFIDNIIADYFGFTDMQKSVRDTLIEQVNFRLGRANS